VNTSVELRDWFAWRFDWLRYICKDCGTSTSAALADIKKAVPSVRDRNDIYRAIGAGLGWYLLEHERNPTWICPQCMGDRVIEAYSLSREKGAAQRRIVSEAAEWRVAVLMIGEGDE
jgi:predicted RNA-binding Zn-ribbon protein involved in translation (DUF1610 family)